MEAEESDPANESTINTSTQAPVRVCASKADSLLCWLHAVPCCAYGHVGLCDVVCTDWFYYVGGTNSLMAELVARLIGVVQPFTIEWSVCFHSTPTKGPLVSKYRFMAEQGWHLKHLFHFPSIWRLILIILAALEWGSMIQEIRTQGPQKWQFLGGNDPILGWSFWDMPRLGNGTVMYLKKCMIALMIQRWTLDTSWYLFMMRSLLFATHCALCHWGCEVLSTNDKWCTLAIGPS